MRFSDWLFQHKMSDAEFARVSGIGQRALVHKYRHGRQIPSFENAWRIEQATGGKVTPNDFFAEAIAKKQVSDVEDSAA